MPDEDNGTHLEISGISEPLPATVKLSDKPYIAVILNGVEDNGQVSAQVSAFGINAMNLGLFAQVLEAIAVDLWASAREEGL